MNNVMKSDRTPTIASRFRRLVKRFLPNPVIKMYVDYVTDRNRSKMEGRFDGLSAKEVFTKIYAEGHWGRPEGDGEVFYSGSGSHDQKIVASYADAVANFLQTLPAKPDVVDLGCGDFAIGSKLRPYCRNYVACDIVEPLIAFNRERFASQDVDFRVLDLTRDEPPPADVVFIRQVLQHLSNSDIAGAIPKIQTRFRYLVLTEHLPGASHFEHNVDKPAGPDLRLGLKGRASGVVLTSPPFNLNVVEERVLCETHEFGAVIRTILYRLR